MVVLKVYGGIEGGGTKTILSIIDSAGRLRASGHAGPSNPWLLSKSSTVDESDGFANSAKLINQLIQSTLQECSNGLGEQYELVSVALCMSGGGSPVAKGLLVKAFEKLEIGYKVFVTNDAFAALFTASPQGGVVIISGTGSNCVLVNPLAESVTSMEQIEYFSSGGWGYHLGDEGSGFWIAIKLIKYLISVNDGLVRLGDQARIDEYERLRCLVFEHFQIDGMKQILPYFYSGSQNHVIANLTSKLVEYAADVQVVSRVFEEAGFELARQLVALEPKMDRRLLELPQGLPVVCSGSVFKSWHLLRPGFKRGLDEAESSLKKLHLVTVKGNDSTFGAAWLAKKLSPSDEPSVSPVDANAEARSQDLEVIERP